MASGLHKTDFKGTMGWIDQRLPIFSMLQKEYGVFPTPKNFNYFWNFGAIAMFMLVFMIATGLFLSMNYAANVGIAFDSVERIMRDVNFGWLLRYAHANGASMFFIVIYIHMFRGLYYGSYKNPRELLWILGVTIFLLLMATAFMGYVLPWGQMSFWGATVITNLFSAIPLVGNDIVTWLWGGFSVDNSTLNRFFALHFLMPFVITAVVFLHIWALHITGSNNPLGIEPKSGQDTLPFHPYYTSKDIFGLMVFLIIFAGFVFFAPNFLGHPDNYIPANPMVTPAHIVPEWYFLPFYAILRAVPDVAIPFTHIVLVEAKLAGVLGMFGAIAVLFVIPWIDRSPIRSARFRPAYKFSTFVFLLSFALLGMAGSRGADDVVNLGFAELPWLYISRATALYYFAHFTVILWAVSMFETRPVLPNSIHEAVLAENTIKKATNKKPWVIARVLSVVLVLMFLATLPAWAAGEAEHPHKQDWPFNGPTGTFDRASLQRGFQVYKEVCSACHGMHLVSYRNLQDIGLSELQTKAIAAQYNVTDGPNDEGDMFERPARPADRFKAPYANEKQARVANNGAYPPDMSLLAKARHDGSNYIYSLLTGYSEPPKSFDLGKGMHYNKFYPGKQIAMTAPLVTEGQVTYADGTPASIKQMAWDVTQFLTWAAEPKMEERKKMGVKVMLFLGIFAAIMYAVKRKIWSDVDGH